MRALLALGILLSALPAIAADGTPQDLPSPPPVTYEVWGFKWDRGQFVRQPTQSLSTTDLKKAADYADQVDSYAGWKAVTNLPDACFVHTIFHGPTIASARPTSYPTRPVYTVWAYQSNGGQWVKDQVHSWTTRDPVAGLDYATKVNAVPGWRATTNCPPPVPEAQRYVDGGTVQGAEYFYAHAFGIDFTGRTIRLPFLNMTIHIPNRSNWSTESNDTDGGSYYEDWSSTQSSNSIQDSDNIQDMINTQNMLNNQMMLNNIQDMVNTQNMINTQNMVNTQNMIDAQNAMNAQMNNP